MICFSPRVCVFVLLIAISHASSQSSNRHVISWQPSPLIKETAMPNASVSKNFVVELHVSGLKVVLEETKLTDVQALFGGTIGQRGDAAESLEWLCYQVSDGGSSSVLWLMSAEVDGGAVGGFQWIEVSESQQIDKRCQKLPAGGVRLPRNLRLGMKASLIVQEFGKPTRQDGNRLEYVHEEQLRIRNEPYTEINTLHLLLRDKIVRGVEVWMSTTS
jgi:hypothetical protein